MDSNNLFIMATQHKFRFPFKGQVSVEDLWDLNVHDLDTVFKALNAQSKQSKEESLLASKSKADSILEAKLEVVKYIVTAKLAEAEEQRICAGWNDAVDAMPRWISVEERLPDDQRDVLAVNGHGYIRMMGLWGKRGEQWRWLHNGRFVHYNDISHWTPLPEPPKEATP